MTSHAAIQKLALARLGRSKIPPPRIEHDIRKMTVGFPSKVTQIHTYRNDHK